MRRHEAKGVAVPAVDAAKLGVADPYSFLQHDRKHRIDIAGRAANDLQHLRRGGLLLQGLVQLTPKPIDLPFLNGSRGIATANSLPCTAALCRRRFAASRFNWFAACNGAPSHCLPPCFSGQGIVAGQTTTIEVARVFKHARPANSLAAFAQSGLFRSERRRGLIFWSPQYQELENPAALLRFTRSVSPPVVSVERGGADKS